MKKQIEKLNKELSEGKWKSKTLLLSIKEDNYQILVLLSNGKQEEAFWSFANKTIEINTKKVDVVAWKHGTMKKSWMKRLNQYLFGDKK